MSFNEWLTPPPLLDTARAFFGGEIDTDPASNPVAQEYVRAKTYYGHRPEGFVSGSYPPGSTMPRKWEGNVWCNPPYDAKGIAEFTAAVIHNWWSDPQRHILYLVNSATATRWYQRCLCYASAVLFPAPRLRFWKIQDGQAHKKWPSSKTGIVGNNPLYTNTLFYFGIEPSAFLSAFALWGRGTLLSKPNASALEERRGALLGSDVKQY